MKAVILVPRRADNGPRDKLWTFCRRRWEALFPDWPIVEGHHDHGPFNRSAAINLAARLADEGGRWDVALIIDADVFLDPRAVRQAVERAHETGKFVWPHRRWRAISQEATERLLRPDPVWSEKAFGEGGFERSILDGADMDLLVEKTNPLSWSCCIAAPREGWDRLGGFDERFAGWGHEDTSFAAAAMGLVGHERIGVDLFHLWHPRSPGLGKAAREGGQYNLQAIVNAKLGARYAVALRRDYKLADRPEPASEEALERDIRNYKVRYDHEDDRQARRLGMDLEAWNEWWPTLDELVDGAKARIPAGPPDTREARLTKPRVAIVVRSGGPAANWPARSDYLRQTLASLAEHVRYEPVVARVLFSDWPAEIRPALEAIANEHGFYVVGEGNAGFTESMRRLWSYLGSRKWPYEHVFLVEDDFLFERDVDLEQMIHVLDERPELVQMALLRDACYQAERESGGILGHPQSEFHPARLNDSAWLEHRRFFTLNPTLFRRSLTAHPWPGAKHSEAVFGRELFRNPNARSALWGDGEAWVRHLGEVRAGAGY